jgi:hypothetical protein
MEAPIRFSVREEIINRSSSAAPFVAVTVIWARKTADMSNIFEIIGL